jgi:hypothetical protein
MAALYKIRRPIWVDYGHSNRSGATSRKSLEANTTSSEWVPAGAPRSKRCCPGAKMLAGKGLLRRFPEGFLIAQIQIKIGHTRSWFAVTNQLLTARLSDEYYV